MGEIRVVIIQNKNPKICLFGVGWGPKIVFPIPDSPDLARREGGWVELLINSIPHELVQVGYKVEMVQDPVVLKGRQGKVISCRRGRQE